MDKYYLKTWECTECGYRQDFEPTPTNMIIHGLPMAGCPNKCESGNLVRSRSDDSKIRMNIKTEAEIEEEEQDPQERVKKKHERLSSIASTSAHIEKRIK